MYIPRDMAWQLAKANAWAQVMVGPRQCGKSTLFSQVTLPGTQEVTFDDLVLRQLANRDPALFLQQFNPPLLLDEVQYVPNLFPEIKKLIDQRKRATLHSAVGLPEAIYRLTGSNQIMMDKCIKESLAGRAQYFFLNTLSVHEIMQALPDTSLSEILFKGGWPELYNNPHLNVITYLNDYIRTYLEKDIALSAGIEKMQAFQLVLQLLAARTGQLGDYTEIAKVAGIQSVTVKEWVGLLTRADLIYRLPPFFNNLNKRLIKTPKWYFLDTGIATRLQGWSEEKPLLHSPQAGALFETLVLAEIVKFIRNTGKSWQLYLWRTKEKEEIDFLIETEHNCFYAFDAKLGLLGSPEKVTFPSGFKKQFNPQHPLHLVTFGQQRLKTSNECMSLPLVELFDFLNQL